MDWEVYLQKCYWSSLLSRFKGVSRAAIETCTNFCVCEKIPVYINSDKGSIKFDVTELHLEKFTLHLTATLFQGHLGLGIFCF